LHSRNEYNQAASFGPLLGVGSWAEFFPIDCIEKILNFDGGGGEGGVAEN